MLGFKTGVELKPELVRLRRQGDRDAMSELTTADCAPCHDDEPNFSNQNSDESDTVVEGVSFMQRFDKGDF